MTAALHDLFFFFAFVRPRHLESVLRGALAFYLFALI